MFNKATRIGLFGSLLLVLSFSISAAPVDDFVTTWKTDNQGSSNDNSITIPTHASETYSYDVDWNNDNVFDEFGITGDVTHDFGSPGTYTIRISGTFPRIAFPLPTQDNKKLISIDRWGNNAWSSMYGAFVFATNVVNMAPDVPNLSACTNLQAMFSGASQIGSATDTGNWDWDTGTITNMNIMFFNATNFNKDISFWNIGNVSSMQNMFKSATNFDQDISSWDFESVTNISGFLENGQLSSSNYDALLVSLDTQTMTSGLSFHGGNSTYCSQAGIDARASLIANDTWMINDGNLCNQAPTITSSATVAMDEHLTDVITVTATDIEMETVNFSISGGADAALFSILATGELSFVTAPDFENPTSSTGTNTYVVDVTATDVGSPPESDTQTITINVTDVFDYQPEDLFKTTWKTDNTLSGSSNATSILIPIQTGLTYAYQVDWNGDGDFDDLDEDTIQTGHATHDYGPGNEGIYTINIIGTFPSIRFRSANKEREKILSIDQWGTNPWFTMSAAFFLATNLENNAPDTPNLTNCTSLVTMFNGASSIGSSSETGNWDWTTNSIESMQSMFSGASSFNQDLSSWNIEAVENATSMFAGVTLSTANYEAMLIAWDAQNVQPNLTFDGGNSVYCSQAATDARQSLIDNDLWVITDGGRDPACEGGNDIDLATTITDNTDTIAAGDLLDYVVEITNNGPDDAVDATVMIAEFTQQPPLVISAYSWVCSATGSATCSASGSTVVNEMVDIPVGDSITYTVTATITTGISFDEVTFAAGASTQTQNDTNPNNNFVVDINTNSDIIFKQGFDPIPQRSVQKVNSSDKQVVVDFSKIDQTLITINPTLIVKGLNDTKQTDLLVHLRTMQGQLQIRMSNKQDGIWQVGQWVNVYNQGITTLEW